MAQLDLPTVQPVEKPTIDVRQVARAGQAAAGLAEDSERMADAGLAIEGHIREAQKHVDSLSAQNELHAAYLGMRTELDKAASASEVPGILQYWKENVNSIVGKYANSPAVREIELDAGKLEPGMEYEATKQRINLLQGEGDVALSKQLAALQSQYANPATRVAAMSVATQAIQGMVETGLHTQAWGEEAIGKFETAGQEQQIEDAIVHPDPQVNQNMWDEINSHPELFPNVPRERLDGFKAKLLEAVGVHQERQKRVQDEVALNRDVPQFRKAYGMADGTVDMAKARVELHRREGEDPSSPDYLTVRQGDIIETRLNAEAADAKRDAEDKSSKAEKEVTTAMGRHEWVKARQLYQKNLPLLEPNVSMELDKSITARSKKTDADISNAEDGRAFGRIRDMDPTDPATEKAITANSNLKDASRKSLYEWVDMAKDKVLKGGLAAGDKYLKSQIAPTKDWMTEPSPVLEAKSAEAQQALSDWVKTENDKARKGGKPLTEADIFEHARQIAPAYRLTEAETTDIEKTELKETGERQAAIKELQKRNKAVNEDTIKQAIKLMKVK